MNNYESWDSQFETFQNAQFSELLEAFLEKDANAWWQILDFFDDREGEHFPDQPEDCTQAQWNAVILFMNSGWTASLDVRARFDRFCEDDFKECA